VAQFNFGADSPHSQTCFWLECQDGFVHALAFGNLPGSPLTAECYTSAIVSFFEVMQFFPHRGTRRVDIRSGLNIA